MIKLYTIDCPACNVLEKKLEHKGIAYEKITDEKVFREKGIDRFPMLEVDGTLQDFSTSVQWVNSQ